MRIDKLEIKNFKFFDEVAPLEFKGRNILLYGENGSGKSTIYWALYTLLQSSKKEDNKIKKYFTHSTDNNPNNSSLVNIYADEDSSKIELFVDEERDRLIISKNEITIKDDTNLMEDTLTTSDFISYKYLFRFFNFLHRDYIDLFNLFEYEILHLIGMNELWQEVVELEKDKPRIIAEKENYQKLLKKLNSFNDTLNGMVEDLNEPANSYFKKFNYKNIKLKLIVKKGLYLKQKFKRPQIRIEISILKNNAYEPLLRPQSYFNEAKLTAIALSVRFAVTKIKLKDSPLKLLVLDDLLISLDMSNRDMVLDILLNDDTLNKYQKIILTHDRAFFEMAKDKFNYVDKNKWNFFEMYVDNEGDIEKPYLKKTNETYHEKAIKYFEQREYEITSNYLRKEVEKQLYNYLGLKTLEGTIETAKIKDNYKKLDNCFAPLIIILKGFDNCKNIPDNQKIEKCIIFAQKVKEALISLENIFEENHFHDINSIKDRILNPQAHYDNSKPLYKRELEDAIALVKALGTILNE